MDGTPNYDRSETIIRQLQSIYPCFGLTCDDIGTLRSIPDGQKAVAIPACVSADNDAPMAQYQPGTDVLPVSVICYICFLLYSIITCSSLVFF